MGQDKEKLIALSSFIEELYNNPENKDFAERINNLVLSNISEVKDGLDKVLYGLYGSISEVKEKASVIYDNSKVEFEDIRKAQSQNLGLSSESVTLMKEIYELCLSKILREHAVGFYKDFPIESIKNSLIEDFVKMEDCKRHGDFDGFCRHMYLQIEYISNYLAKEYILQDAIKLMLDVSPYTDPRNPGVFNRNPLNQDSPYTIRNHVFGKPNETDIQENNFKCNGVSDFDITKLTAMNKFKCIWFFVGLRGYMRNSEYGEWKEMCGDISDLYNYRNKDSHRGSDVQEWVQATYDKISPNADRYTIRFYSDFYKFIDKVSAGYPIPKELVEYANTQKPKEVDFEITSVLRSATYIRLNGKVEELAPKLVSQYKGQIKNSASGKAILKGNQIVELRFS